MIKELFYENGHLTDEAMSALIRQDALDDLQRLEIAEHLSFCEECLRRYLQAMEESILTEPPGTPGQDAIRIFRRKEKLISFKRVITMAAAACLAIVFWWSGLFSWPAALTMDEPPIRHAQEPPAIHPGPLEKLYGGLSSVTEGLGQWTEDTINPLNDENLNPKKENLYGAK